MQYGVNSLDDLCQKIGGIWSDLTTNWFSLRLQENDKAKRRTVHPLWQMVHDCADRFGEVMAVRRTYRKDTPASKAWLVAHISGCFTSFAVRLGIDNREEAFNVLQQDITSHCPDYKFSEEYTKRRIKLNRPVDGVADNYDDTPF
jgi:hypothetical protein